MMVCGLLGQNIAYSLSPIIHKEIAKASHKELSYDLLDGDLTFLKKSISQLKKGVFNGLNVTKPYKSTVMQFLDDFDPMVLTLGAVNTIVLKDGKLKGYNTDYYGFKQTLLIHHVDVSNQNVLLLGSGGAARACYAVLVDLGAHVKVASRHPQKNHNLFKDMIAYEHIDTTYDIYVNAVSHGIDAFHDYKITYNKNALLIDINYQHKITPPMTHFKHAINGIDMLIYQAIYSQSIWFNQDNSLNDLKINQIKEVISHE